LLDLAGQAANSFDNSIDERRLMGSLQFLDIGVKEGFYLPALAGNIFCTGSQ
jgi:hypothetical protein